MNRHIYLQQKPIIWPSCLVTPHFVLGRSSLSRHLQSTQKRYCSRTMLLPCRHWMTLGQTMTSLRWCQGSLHDQGNYSDGFEFLSFSEINTLVCFLWGFKKIDRVFILPIACKLPRGCLISMLDSCEKCYGVCLGSWFLVGIRDVYQHLFK